MKHFLLLGLPLLGSCFFLIDQIAPTQCEVSEPARCEANALVTCESGIESRVQCGAFLCDAELARCGSCGDGFIDTTSGEICDDGNNINGDGCRQDCTEELCGDNLLDPQEVCDDGNEEGGDGCRADCEGNEDCGDFLVDVGEICDDGNTVGDDGCRADCEGIEVCGDGLVDTDTGEGCDDGNAFFGDGCRGDCSKLEVCGDGTIDIADVKTIPSNQIISVRFEYLVTGCGIANSLTFRVNGVTILSPPTNTSCACEPGIESFTVTDPAVLGTLNNGANTFEVEAEVTDDIPFNWALVNAASAQDSVDIIIRDQSNGFNGGAKARQTELCFNNINGAYLFSTTTQGVSEFINEQCDDGNQVDTDSCTNACTLPPVPVP
jgi:cysteine-rich repeat protein